MVTQKIEREKNVESALKDRVTELGGWSIKLPALHFAGIPDRLCLLPGAIAFFCEAKTTKKKPRKLQEKILRKLRSLGFIAEYIDRKAQINPLIEKALCRTNT